MNGTGQKMRMDPHRTDFWVSVITVAFLGATALGGAIGGTILIIEGKKIPPELYTLASTSMGALVGYLGGRAVARTNGPSGGGQAPVDRDPDGGRRRILR